MTTVINKLNDLLNAGIKSEADVVYLLTQIRKFLEQNSNSPKYKFLKFHCDWALHSSLDRGLSKEILERFNEIHIQLMKGLNLQQLPKDLRDAVDDVSAMDKFREELFQFLKENSLPIAYLADFFEWSNFLRLYTGVITDCPLVIQANRPNAQLVKMMVAFEQANKIQSGQIYYKINWVLTDKNGSQGVIFVMNSYEAPQATASQIVSTGGAGSTGTKAA